MKNGTEFITEPLIADCQRLLEKPWTEEELKEGIKEILAYLQWAHGLSHEQRNMQQMWHCSDKEE